MKLNSHCSQKDPPSQEASPTCPPWGFGACCPLRPCRLSPSKREKLPTQGRMANEGGPPTLASAGPPASRGPVDSSGLGPDDQGHTGHLPVGLTRKPEPCVLRICTDSLMEGPTPTSGHFLASSKSPQFEHLNHKFPVESLSLGAGRHPEIILSPWFYSYENGYPRGTAG